MTRIVSFCLAMATFAAAVHAPAPLLATEKTAAITPTSAKPTPYEPKGLYAAWSKLRPPGWQPTHPAQLLGHSLLLSAMAMEALGQPEAAGLGLVSAADLFPELRAQLHMQAASYLIDNKSLSATMAIKRIASLGSLDAPIQGAGLLQAKLAARHEPTTLPTLARAQGALSRGPRQESCAWLSAQLNPKATPWAELIRDEDEARVAQRLALAQLIHGSCLGPKNLSLPKQWKVPIDTDAALARADLLYDSVRFYLAKAELEGVEIDKLPLAKRCQAKYLLGKTLYRIRKERDKAQPLFVSVAKDCKDDALLGLRQSSLYAAGKRAYEIDKLTESKGHFEALAKLGKESRYADDAFYYLAKIARATKRPKDAQALVTKALKEASDGDMIFELVWEQYEDLYRAKKYRDFIKAIDALTLPEHDDNYFSQGRLEYFKGMAYAATKAPKAPPKEAIAAWRSAWARYPFSFYGYLSWGRLKQAKAKDLTLSRPDQLDPQALFAPEWSTRPEALLAQLGRFEQAAQAYKPQASTPDQQWALAWLYELAQHPEVSHNIARRRIPNSPWATPDDALRPVRWLIAWPNPFAQLVEEAVKAEAKQAEKVALHQAFPLSIMREESSFIPAIESYAGALGLMQLMPRTALAHDDDIKGDATPEQLKKPEVNIRVGVDHLFTLSRVWDGHPAMMAASYNAGSGGLRRWVRAAKTQEIGLFVEDITSFQTRNYTKRVIGSYMAYQWLLGVDDFDMKVLGDAPKK